MLKPDKWIINKCVDENLIEPFNTNLISEHNGHNILSHGVSFYEYDLSLLPERFKIFVEITGTIHRSERYGRR